MNPPNLLMVGETGFEPATLCSQTDALPSCATPRILKAYSIDCEDLKHLFFNILIRHIDV